MEIATRPPLGGSGRPGARDTGPASESGSPGRRSRRREAACVLALVILATLVRLPTLSQPLQENHGFRQTQTAYTAVIYHEQGVDLLHPQLPVFGAPFETPFEFPLFQALAAGVMSWGMPADVAMRTTALVCFLLSALLLWGLVRHVGGRVAAMAALVLFLFSPFTLLWSRASLIEYLAVAGALGWLWAGLLWRERRRLLYAAAALAGGLTVMLVKPTTGAFWLLPLLAYPTLTEGRGWRTWLRARSDPVLAVIIVVPFAAAVAWTGHADAIKGASRTTAWLTSSGLREWNFGTLRQRTIHSEWSMIVGRITTQLTLFPGWLIPFTALVGLRTRTARFWAALAAVPVLTILVFFNLYVFHDYYLAAISPVPAALVGYGFARLWQALVPTRGPRFLVTAFAAWTAALLLLGSSIWSLAYRDIEVSDKYPEVAEVAGLTLPTDLIAFDGYAFTPEVPYYSRRIGRLIGWEPTEPPTADELAGDGYRVLVTKRLRSDLGADTIRTGRWTGVLGEYVYITGDSQADLRGAPVSATDDDVDTGTNLLAQPLTVACGMAGTVLPPTAGATVVELAAETPRTAKLSVARGYGDVPARAHIVVRAGLVDGPITVTCRDAATVTIVGVAEVRSR